MADVKKSFAKSVKMVVFRASGGSTGRREPQRWGKLIGEEGN
jgi:hypothetical protein